jgi:3-methyl-2-oxobutanoate hydroxymethyltransferase
MSNPLPSRFTLDDLREARRTGTKLAMLTCYDFTMARLMEESGIRLILVGDSAASVILGHDSTIPVGLEFMIEITQAVRRGAPGAFLIADMPFGSYHASTAAGVRSVCRMVKSTNCDCVKIEVAPRHTILVSRLADAGVAVMAHLGLRPQAVAVLGGYKAQGRTRPAADAIVEQALAFERAGAVAILLEAVPPDVSQQVINAVGVPVVGCGAGPACHAHVVVTHDMLKLTPRAPKFVPVLADMAAGMKTAFAGYIDQIAREQYPGPEHAYSMLHDPAKR